MRFERDETRPPGQLLPLGAAGQTAHSPAGVTGALFASTQSY